MKIIVVLCLIMLASCATTQPLLPKEVNIPVSVSCIKESPVKPLFRTHDELKALNNSDFVIQSTIELLKYESYTGELESLIIGCK